MASESVIRFYERRELQGSHAGWRDIVPHIHRQIDDVIAGADDVACKPGCSHCCKLMVHALPHEMMEVVDYIRFSGKFDREARDATLERLRHAVRVTDGMDHDQYRAANLPCPFLGSNDLCTVYPVRPIACRAFGSRDVRVCKLEVEDYAGATFKVAPDSLMKLLWTSGLFFGMFLKGCLDWWQGEGVTTQATEEEMEHVAMVRKFVESGGQIATGRQ